MSPCPTPESLERLLAGTLDPPAADTVEQHVAACAACEGRLARLSDDPELRSWLRAADDGAGEEEVGPGLAGVLYGAGAGPAAPPASEEGPAGLSFLGPPRRAGDLGSLGPYDVEAELGRGGMGVVFRACDAGLGRPVALKVLRPELARGTARQRFVQEARAAARVRHDHVVTVFAVANPGDSLPYFTMELLAGPSLADLVRRGPLEPRHAARLVAQAAEGLAAAHAAGLVHRDVKPANILLDPAAERARVCDFGLAYQAAPAADRLSQSGAVLGTPAYMSPEQARGAEGVDGRTDVYGLGATLYEALTGAVPFRGQPHLVLQQVLHEEPRPPRRLNDRVPRDLETICLKAMAKEPGRRYAGARALADDLHRFLRGEPIRARPVGPAGRLARWGRRRPQVAGLLLALALAVAAGVAGVAWQWSAAVAQRDAARRAQAQAEKDRAQAQIDFRRACGAVDAYLTDVSEDPDLKALPLEPLRRKLLQKARDYYERFVAEHPDDPDLALELARANGRLGDIVGALESGPRAVPYYVRQQELCRQLLRERPGDVACRRELAWCCRALGTAQYFAGDSAAAVESLRQARALHEALVGEHPDDAEDLYQLLKTLNNVGRLAQIAKHRDEAEEAYQAGRAAYDRWGAAHPPEPRLDGILALLLSNWSSLYAETGRPRLGQEKLREAIAAGERVARASPGDVVARQGLLEALLELGQQHLQGNELDAAAGTLGRARDVGEALLRDHPSHPDYQKTLAVVWYTLGEVRQRQRRTAEARAAYERALEIQERRVRDFPDDAVAWGDLFLSQVALGELLRGAGEFPAALAVYRHALDVWEQGSPPAKRGGGVSGKLSELHLGEGKVLLDMGRFAEAERQFDQALAPSRADGRGAAEALRAYAAALRRVEAGDHAAATAAWRARAAAAPKDPETAARAATVFARAAAAAREDPQLSPADRARRAEDYAAAAVGYLRTAAALGEWQGPDWAAALQKDPSYAPLRGREDFHRLLAEVGPAGRAGREVSPGVR